MSFFLSEYTKIDVGWRFAPDPTGELIAPPDPLAGFTGPLRSRRRMDGRGGKD